MSTGTHRNPITSEGRDNRKKPKSNRSLKRPRKWHRWLGIGLSLLVLISSVTGLLLAWKKQSSWLQPQEVKGVSTDISNWAVPSQIASAAIHALSDSLDVPIDQLPTLDRLDSRPKRGVVKVLFKSDWEVQVDATTAEVYSVAKRNADWIERLHDGSIISDWFKLGIMTLLAAGLLFLTGTGVWMWWVRRG